MADVINGLPAANVSSTPTQSKSKSVDPAAQKDQFLKLLTFQLKAQNPMKPYDNQQFASQLAQFSQLEQLSDIRSLMEEQNKSNLALTKNIQNSALPGMLGKYAKAETSLVSYDGEGEIGLGVSLNKPAAEGQMTIYDENGTVVRKMKLKNSDLSFGDHSVKWDGKDDLGRQLPKGTYSFFTDMKDSTGAEFEANTYTNGEIEAVRFKSSGTMLVIGGLEVPLANVTDISTRN